MKHTITIIVQLQQVENEAGHWGAGERRKSEQRHEERERRAVALGAREVQQQRREEAVLEAVPQAVHRVEHEERLDAQEKEKRERRQSGRDAFADEADQSDH